MSTEQKNQKPLKGGNNNQKTPNKKFSFYWIYIAMAVFLIGLNFFNFGGTPSREITENKLYQDMLLKGHIDKIVIVNNEFAEIYIKKDSLKQEPYVKDKVPESGAQYKMDIDQNGKFEERLTDMQKDIAIQDRIIPQSVHRSDWTKFLISWILPLVILIAIWMFIMRRAMGGGGIGGGGGQIFNIGKSKANLYDKDTKVNVTFNDVAGLDEAKEEVMEVVDFLKNPKKYTSLGGKIPKGVLLVGSPGTGKTLLAKAMAGEAQVPFFSISGSDFVEMFVGVGASRVRDLFKQAREKAPCIVFIDEIDAIGRARGKNMIQSNDERENTLNQLLVEMDGFGTDKGVIILAATNRPDVLDPALLRPGRFDRQISIDKPDLNGREQIFKVHLKPLTKLSKDVDPHKLALQTPGFAGAEIANICNEAALIAARRGKKLVEMQDFNDAIDRSIGGLEKKNKLISPEEKKIVAYHEAGHAICGWFLEHADPLVKVSIVPRGVAALGYAQYNPKDQYLYTTEQLTDMMCMTLGGRAAEDIIFGSISTGAQNDLERITKMAYAMVSIYGMNKKVGNVSFYDANQDYRFSKPYSEELAKVIDEEVRKLIEEAYNRTKNLLLSKKDELEAVAKELLDKEIIFKADLERLIGPRPYEKKEEHAVTNAEVTFSENGHADEKTEEAVTEENTEKKD